MAALRQTGNQMESHFRGFHQVLNRARWSPLAVSRQLLTLIVESFVEAGGSVDLMIDETLERRWGAKISKRGPSRESALSSHKRGVEQSWSTLDRDGSGRHFAMDAAKMGLAVCVCSGNDP